MHTKENIVDDKQLEEYYNFEAIYEMEYDWDINDEGYFITKLLDYTIKSLDDRAIQRILRETQNADISIIIKGLSKAGMEKIFHNLSKRLGAMIAEDITFMGPVTTEKVGEISEKTMKTIIKLMIMGEIASDNYRITKLMTSIFTMDKGSLTSFDRMEKEHELELLFKKYKERHIGIIR